MLKSLLKNFQALLTKSVPFQVVLVDNKWSLYNKNDTHPHPQKLLSLRFRKMYRYGLLL